MLLGFIFIEKSFEIIDGTEVFVEEATSVKTQAQASSDYKHRPTWKKLVGISCNGRITFVSPLWTGQISDKELAKCSDFLEKLGLRDNIMADREFNIANILSSEISEAARIAAVRIHVERAMDRIKNCYILNGSDNDNSSMIPLPVNV